MTSVAFSTHSTFLEPTEPLDPALERPYWGLWDDLAEGRCIARGTTYSSTRCALRIVRCNQPRTATDLRGHEYLRRVLVGEAMKEVAFTAKRSLSTIAAATTHALRQMGFRPGILYVPLPLIRAADLKSGFNLPPLEVAPGDTPASYEVTIERPETCLKDLLSACECEVLSAMLEGGSNREIAVRRRVAARTVANQVASISAKLGVSGRLELLRLFARGEQLERATQRLSVPAWSARIAQRCA